MNGQEFPTSLARNSPKHEFPSGVNDFNPYNQYQQQSGYPPGIPSGTPPPPPQHQDLTIDGIPNLPPGSAGNGAGGAPFPHRRSRASRTFKNPPQPHMCIREKTIDGKEVFINVLSWTRIANPDNPDAPIPLYGGMKVGKIPPGSPRAPPLVYAVMASPEVLKKAGRKCPDTPERMNLVDLMCEFVEAMNPTLHLSRKPEILKDRDLSGELKDVWSAVQACRDKGRVDSVGPPENLVVYTEFGPETAPSYEQSQHHQQQQHQQQYHHQQHFPHHQHQQHHYGGEPFHQQQPQNHHQQQPQSAITNNSSSSSSNNNNYVDVNSSDSPDGPVPVSDCAAVSDQLDELCQEADSLKIAPSKSNGLTLPTTTSPTGSAEATPATSPESNPVPATLTAAPQQQQGISSSSLSTSPTSPTSTVTPVSPTATPSPATPQKESKNTSHFFPMFRSSKSSSAEKSAAASEKDANGGSPADPTVANSAAGTQPDTPVKTSSKKSGLNFFRRNKTDSKKSTTEAPATPTKQKDSSAGDKTAAGQLIDKLDESLQHLHHHHHHGGSNGTGEIIENSSATIVAK